MNLSTIQSKMLKHKIRVALYKKVFAHAAELATAIEVPVKDIYKALAGMDYVLWDKVNGYRLNGATRQLMNRKKKVA